MRDQIQGRQRFGQNQDHGQLGKFRGLNGESPKGIQPGFHAGRSVEDPHDEKKRIGCKIQSVCKTLEPVVGDVDHDGHDDRGNDHEKALAHGK